MKNETIENSKGFGDWLKNIPKIIPRTLRTVANRPLDMVKVMYKGGKSFADVIKNEIVETFQAKPEDSRFKRNITRNVLGVGKTAVMIPVAYLLFKPIGYLRDWPKSFFKSSSNAVLNQAGAVASTLDHTKPFIFHKESWKDTAEESVKAIESVQQDTKNLNDNKDLAKEQVMAPDVTKELAAGAAVGGAVAATTGGEIGNEVVVGEETSVVPLVPMEPQKTSLELAQGALENGNKKPKVVDINTKKEITADQPQKEVADAKKSPGNIKKDISKGTPDTSKETLDRVTKATDIAKSAKDRTKRVKEIVKDGEGLLKDAKTMAKDAKTRVKETKELIQDGKNLVKESDQLSKDALQVVHDATKPQTKSVKKAA